MRSTRTVLACLFAVCSIVLGITKDDVLSIRDGRFYLDGKPFAEISFNKFDLFWQLFDQANAGIPLDDTNAMVIAQDEALKEIASMGMKTIRIFGMPWALVAFSPVYDDPVKRETVFYATVNRTLDLCDKNGIRVVYSLGLHGFRERTLVNGKWIYGEEHIRELLGDPGSRSRKRMNSFLDEFIPRMKGRRAVAMWEIGNEITLAADIGDSNAVFEGERQPTLRQVADFYRDVTARIKTLDTIRLVNNGGSCLRNMQWNRYQKKGWALDTFEEQLMGYSLLFADTGVDVIDIHHYPNNRQGGGYEIMGANGTTNILDDKGFMEIAKRLNKPLMIGELGALPFPRDARNKKVWDATPDYFESYADVAQAKPWVKRAVDNAANAGISLVYWWAYSSDRPMDRKKDRHDLKKGRDDELLAVIMDANRRLKEKLGVTAR